MCIYYIELIFDSVIPFGNTVCMASSLIEYELEAGGLVTADGTRPARRKHTEKIEC